MKLLYTIGLILTMVVALSAEVGTDSLIASQDNTLYEHAEGKISNGSGSHFFVGKNKDGLIRRGVLKFDLTTLPENIEIQSAILRLSVAITEDTTPMDHHLHAITQDWGEGFSNADDSTDDGNGASAMKFDATWLHTFFATDGDPTWDNPGGDFEATPTDTLSIGNTGIYALPLNKVAVDLIQLWYENPDTNFGFILIGNESDNSTTRTFNSREQDNLPSLPQLKITYEVITGIGDITTVPGEFNLEANYPNPFNPSTTIRYQIDKDGIVNLDIFNAVGQRIRVLDSGFKNTGDHTAVWDGRNDAGISVPSGTYFYRLQAGSSQQVKKMLLVK